MQVDALKITDFIKSDDKSNISPHQKMSGVKDGSTADVDSNSSVAVSSSQVVSADGSFYKKNGCLDDEEDFAKKLEEADSIGSQEMAQIENVKHSWDTTATQKTMEDGIDPLDVDTQTLITVVDQIKMNILKAGGDISKMGGLTDAEIQKMATSYQQAIVMEQGLTDTLTPEAVNYLVKNDLEPTIENLFNATYKAPTNASTALNENDEQIVKILEQLSDKLDEIITELENAGVEESYDEIKSVCGSMIANDIPLNQHSIEYMLELLKYEKPESAQIDTAISDIVMEGKEPKDAYMISGYSLMDQAKDAVDTVNSVEFESLFEDISARRQLEEVRLTMTVEATFTMMKSGREVDLTNLQQLLDNLKFQENSLLKILMRADSQNETENNVNIFERTMSKLADLNEAPEYYLGAFPKIGEATFNQVHTVSISFSAEYSRMQDTYDSVGTQVRRDLGDSINKAFQNVDDILADLNLEITEENQKAVRILAYNQMEITTDSVLEMKNTSELVNRTFKNMTPQVVCEMIRRGNNPLDMKMSDLKDMTEEIKATVGADSDTESFSEFLYKAQKSGELSQEERDSYIGIYRLLHQVEKNDGAAIGALMGQGTEVTLRNLMTAVRSRKHSGMEYEVSDATGVLDELVVKDLSITQQVEKVFMTNRCRDALETMTPNKMHTLGEDIILEMNPDEFATAMENSSDEAGDAVYQENITNQLLRAMEIDKDIIRVMDNFDVPKTANMISAMQELMLNSNKAIKNMYENCANLNDISIEDLINEAYSRFAEACKSPEEMAEAEEALEVLAENVMKTMLVSEETDAVDFDDMRLVMQQCKAMGHMANSAETYHIPIMVADEVGNMNLRIVRGTGESGLIKMALYLEQTGAVTTNFKYEDNKVTGEITCENAQTRDFLMQNTQLMQQKMSEATGFEYSFNFSYVRNCDVNQIYQNETGNFGSYSDAKRTSENQNKSDRPSAVQTKALYSIAQSFLKMVGEISQ